jgi:hypothetical protein
MRKLVPVLVVASSILLLVGVTGGLAVYRALHEAPAFYLEALDRDAESQQRDSDRFLQQALALASDMQHKEPWRIAFTADEINGWLAVDVPNNFADAIPEEVQEPRVEITPQGMTIACHLNKDGIDGVVSVSVDVFVSGPNEIAIQFKKATLGRVPMPLGKLLEPISRAAARLDLACTWRQQDGDPVAVLTLSSDGSDSRGMQLEAIELSDGELLIAGRKAAREHPTQLDDEVADAQEGPAATSAAATKENRQR